MRNRILYLFASLVILSGCGNQPAYKNSNLSPEERAEDLLQQASSKQTEYPFLESIHEEDNPIIIIGTTI